MVDSPRRRGLPLLVGVLSLGLGLAGCSSAEEPTNAETTSSAAASPTPATTAPPPPPAATPTPKPAPPPNPLEGFSGTYVYVETVTSSYYSTKDVGDKHTGTWTASTQCTKQCVSAISQQLKNENQAFTLKGKSRRFTGDSAGGATCIGANGKATGQKIKAEYAWDLKADKTANGQIRALNGRKTFEILQNCKKQKTKGFKITYQVSLRRKA